MKLSRYQMEMLGDYLNRWADKRKQDVVLEKRKALNVIGNGLTENYISQLPPEVAVLRKRKLKLIAQLDKLYKEQAAVEARLKQLVNIDYTGNISVPDDWHRQNPEWRAAKEEYDRAYNAPNEARDILLQITLMDQPEAIAFLKEIGAPLPALKGKDKP